MKQKAAQANSIIDESSRLSRCSCSKMLFGPLYRMWSATLHPCLMLKLSGGHIYHTRTTAPYLFQVTQERYSLSTGDDGHESTDSWLSVLIPLVWRSHFFLRGADRCKTVTSLSPTVAFSCHFTLGRNWFRKHRSLGDKCKKTETFFTSRRKEAADISHVGLWECFSIPAAAFLNAWGEETRCWVSGLHNKSFLSWSKIEMV